MSDEATTAQGVQRYAEEEQRDPESERPPLEASAIAENPELCHSSTNLNIQESSATGEETVSESVTPQVLETDDQQQAEDQATQEVIRLKSENPPRQRLDGLSDTQVRQVLRLIVQVLSSSERSSQPQRDNGAKRTTPAAQDLVTYTIRSKTSKNDSYWNSESVSEEEWDRMHVEGYGSVLEMRKDGYLSKSGTRSSKFSALIDETMVIHSPYLIKVMPELVGYYPSSKNAGGKLSVGTNMMKVSRPYRMLGGARENIQKVRERYRKELEQANSRTEQAKQDLEMTVKHIEKLEHELDKVLEEPIAAEKQRYQQTPPVASFDMLWLLFRPGQLVYTNIDGEWACCMVLLPVWGGGQIMDDTWTPVYLTLRLWFLDFNGKCLDRRSHDLRIENFSGPRNILDLEAYPVNYHPDPGLRDKLLKRGKRYMTLLKDDAPQCMYDGVVFREQDKEKSMKKRHSYTGKVVVDPVFHYREHGPPNFGNAWLPKSDIWPSDNNNSGEMKKYVDIDPAKENGDLEDSHYLLLARFIRGFTLGTRQWVWLDIESIIDKPVKEHDHVDPMQELQIDPDSLSMIKAFTPKRRLRQRSSKKEDAPVSFDPIDGKGEGRIMLLYGKPGTGKTFTVECLAKDTGRPLLRLSCKELGIDAVALESRLWEWFRMAEEWQGILLIDEADVYLHQRGLSGSVERETIVTVFLRALEYYRGVLFLTANQMGKFDEAILNRVSPLIHMPGLENSQRERLVEKHKDKIKHDGRYDLLRGALENLDSIAKSSRQYNGREIKTIFHMAIAFATEDHSKNCCRKDSRIAIDGDHVKRIMENMEKFAEHQKLLKSEGSDGFEKLGQGD